MVATSRCCLLTLLLLTLNVDDGEPHRMVTTSGDHNERQDQAAQYNADWSYDQNGGAEAWTFQFPSCGGDSQSPVPLDTTLAKRSHGPQLHWFGWHHKPDKQMLRNNGHSVVLFSEWKRMTDCPQVWLGQSPVHYLLHQVHFHWGKADCEGSEHTLNNERFPLEMHVVTYDKNYGSLAEAVKHPRGVLVIGYFFRLSQVENAPLSKMVSQHLHRVARFNSSHTLTTQSPLADLVPTFSKSFLTYNGSLTTPPCSQGVTWILSKDIRKVSGQQVKQFRQLKNHHNYPILFNWRPLQPLNYRQVKQIV